MLGTKWKIAKNLISAGRENAIDHIEEHALSTEQKQKLPLEISCQNFYILQFDSETRAGKIPLDSGHACICMYFAGLFVSHQN